jgi:hypothetical protein
MDSLTRWGTHVGHEQYVAAHSNGSNLQGIHKISLFALSAHLRPVSSLRAPEFRFQDGQK